MPRMIDGSRSHANQWEGYNRSLIVSITLESRVINAIEHEPESSAAVVGWKFMECDNLKASGAHPQKFHLLMP
jgi:hypothetical protein